MRIVYKHFREFCDFHLSSGCPCAHKTVRDVEYNEAEQDLLDVLKGRWDEAFEKAKNPNVRPYERLLCDQYFKAKNSFPIESDETKH